MKEVCSISNKHQDLSINKYDKLCQSYSLLSYFNKEINTTVWGIPGIHEYRNSPNVNTADETIVLKTSMK